MIPAFKLEPSGSFKQGMALPSLTSGGRAIATLVSRRNKIAHGERDIIPEFDYYLKFEEAAKSVMYELALAVDEKLGVD